MGVALLEVGHSFVLKINTEHSPFAKLWARSLSAIRESKTWLCLPKRAREGKRKGCHLWGTY